MHTGQKVTRKRDKFDDEKFIRIKPEQIISERTRYEDEDNKQYYCGFVNENTHLNMKMDFYMSNIITNLGAQTHPPEQELTPLIVLQAPFINIPPHGPGSGAYPIARKKLRLQVIIKVTITQKDHTIKKSQT